MHGGRDQNSLAHRRGRMEQGGAYLAALRLVHEYVFAPSRSYGKGGHFFLALISAADFVGVYAGAVYYRPSSIFFTVFRDNKKVFALSFNTFHACIKVKTHAVPRGVFTVCHRHFVGTSYTRRSAPESGGHVRRNVRFEFAHPVAADYFQSLHPVFHAAAVERLQDILFFLIEGKHHTAVAAVRKIKTFGFLFHHGAAEDVELCFQTAFFGVESAVDDARICFARAAGNVVRLFQHGNIRRIGGKTACQRTAYYAAADYYYIKKIFHKSTQAL